MITAGSLELIVVGAFAEIIELAEQCGERITGLIDPRRHGEYRGYPVLGDDADAARIRDQHPAARVFISIDDPTRRAGLVQTYSRCGFAFATLVHPQAHVSPSARIGVGALIQYGAVLSADVAIADHVRVNTYASVTHDVRVGVYSTVAPSAVILGRVTVGERCYVGAHSTILPDLTIGDGACVGAHANVTKSVAPGDVVVGNPARSLPRRG